MVWYFVVIPIVLAIVAKIVIPYIRKNYIDNTVICGICRIKYDRKLFGCPNCGVGNK
ncbi:hypothetical protein K0U27_03545 [archaeon]|nr:hypothetical protein [archaeon]